MKDAYVDEFERWTAGPAARKKQLRAELEAHLEGAEQAGELEAALHRLGTPREAAIAFADGYEPTPAPLPRRIFAAMVDIAALGGALMIGIAIGTAGSMVMGSTERIRQVDVTTIENVSNIGPMEAAGLLISIAAAGWWVIGLTIMEWRTGRTPGKKALGLRVVTESGTAPSFGQIVVRRLTLVFSGPLQIIDWAFALFDERHQRGLDKLARTIVVTDDPKAAPEAQVAASAF